MRISGFKVQVLCLSISLVAGSLPRAWAESKYVFGGHFWDWGANIDEMSHRTGWSLEACVTHDGSLADPSRCEDITGEGFTIIQRLNWEWGGDGEETVPKDPAEQDTFASQCANNWANRMKKYCRHYVIGNEMEIAGSISVSEYVSAFQKVRTAIHGVQPDAKVIIGHWCDEGHLLSTLEQLGQDGYDGVATHSGNSLPTGRLNMLDDPTLHPEGAALPGVGVYVTEWGWSIWQWVIPGVERSPPTPYETCFPRMRDFAADIGDWNSTHDRQVYCATWFVYSPAGAWHEFSLQDSAALGYFENQAFEDTTIIGAAVNSYADNPVIMSELYADIWNTGTGITLSWETDVPARRQFWWAPAGAAVGQSTTLNDSLSTTHSHFLVTSPHTEYQVMPLATKDSYGDAGGRRYRVKSGQWNSSATQTGPGRISVEWTTDWPTDSLVEYGLTDNLGQSKYKSALRTDHSVEITDLVSGTWYYRVLSSEEDLEYPDPDSPRLYMRSPIRTTTVGTLVPGDFDDDDDVDQEDFGRFQACLTGDGVTLQDESCVRARLDNDQDVDGEDLDLFIGCMSGAGVDGDPDCRTP